MAVGQLRIMGDRGDFKVIWDSDKPDEVTAARDQHDKLKAKGYRAFKVDKKGEAGELMTKFDPEAEKIIMTAPHAGG